jgi:hypothetical protein
MSAYFDSNHASADKTAPRQHINSNKHVKSKIAKPSKTKKGIYVVRSTTACPPKARMETYAPKLKQPIVKAVYRVKSPVVVKENVVRVKNIVLPDKGQFFKYSGPNQAWVPKKV